MSDTGVVEGYDVIGDIHGHGDELLALLVKLGYYHDGVSYTHDSRQVIFLGDFIDRGPQQRQVVQTAMAMCGRGSARSVMGNHEFNALAYHTQHPLGSNRWLRPRNEKNTKQHQAFLREYLDSPEELRIVLNWFMELPLWLELPEGLRIVHACWDPESINFLRTLLGPGDTLTDEILVQASQSGSKPFAAVETLLKGKELHLPEGLGFTDKDGFNRHEIRIKWWMKDAVCYADLAMPPYVVERNPQLQKMALPAKIDIGYDECAVPVLFGHYWFEGQPTSIAQNVACLDYSVPRPTGRLVAYRWSGERELKSENFVSVDNMTGPY